MKNLMMWGFLALVLQSCDDDPCGDQIRCLTRYDLQQENTRLREELHQQMMVNTYYNQPQVCLENSIYAGCLVFKNKLDVEGVKLKASQWATCDKYKDKK